MIANHRLEAASSRALASLRSAVSKPSVKEEYIAARCVWSGFPSIRSRRCRLNAALNSQDLAPCRFAIASASLKDALASDKIETPDESQGCSPALNESLMKLRKRRQNRETPLEYENDLGDNLPLDLTDWSPNPEQIYGSHEFRSILLAALDKLRPILRATFVLRDLEGLSIDETSATLGLTPTAVKARLFRARLQLRERLSRHFRRGCE